MEYVVRPAPDGVRASWFVDTDEDLLVILVADDLDELKRQRFIAEAKREHGIETERRRRIAIPFILPAVGRRTAGQQATVAAGAVAVAAAVAAAAAVMVPAALDDNSNQVHRQPAHAAAPPSRPSPPGGPGSRQPKRPSSPPPAQPAPSGTAPPVNSAEPSKPLKRLLRHGHGKPSLALPSTRPLLPVKLPPVARPPMPVTAAKPGPRHLCIRISAGIQVRIGCGKR